MENKTKKVSKKVLNIFLWVIFGFAVVVTLLALTANFSKNEVPTLFNTCMISVKTDSMNDLENGNGFAAGDVIFCKVLNVSEKNSLEVGDVITFKAGDLDEDKKDDYNSHRITKVEVNNGFTYYTTKGDNNTYEDSDPILADAVVAKWTGKRIAGVGKFMSFLQSATGFGILVVIPLGGLFIYELITFVITITKYKTKKEQQIGFSKEEEELIKQKAIEEYLAKQKENNEK